MTELFESLDRTILLGIHQGWRGGVGDKLFPWLTESDHFLIPLALLWLWMIIRGGRRWRVTALLVLICLVATDQISSQLIKPWVGRVRPCFEPELRGEVTALAPVASVARSFPSSHAANMFGAATVLWRRGGARWLWVFLPAGLVGFSRIYVGVHYPSDVLAGAGIGLACGGLLCALAARVPAGEASR